MGKYVVCGTCGAEVYTTGDRFPPHNIPGHQVTCEVHNPLSEQEKEYMVGFDHHPRDYYGGAWELGKDT